MRVYFRILNEDDSETTFDCVLQAAPERNDLVIYEGGMYMVISRRWDIAQESLTCTLDYLGEGDD